MIEKVRPTPAYAKIASDLRDRIDTGDLTGQLPAEKTLAAHYEASVNTIRRALAALAADAVVHPVHGSGWYVTPTRPRLTHWAARAEDPGYRSTADRYVTEVRTQGGIPSQTIAVAMVAAPAGVAEWLQVEPGAAVVRRHLRRFVNGEPRSLQTSYYPADVADAAGLGAPEDIQGGTIRAIEAAGWKEVGWIGPTIARPPTPDERDQLDLAPGQPVLHETETAWTETRPVRMTVTIHRGDLARIVHERGKLPRKARVAADR